METTRCSESRGSPRSGRWSLAARPQPRLQVSITEELCKCRPHPSQLSQNLWGGGPCVHGFSNAPPSPVITIPKYGQVEEDRKGSLGKVHILKNSPGNLIWFPLSPALATHHLTANSPTALSLSRKPPCRWDPGWVTSEGQAESEPFLSPFIHTKYTHPSHFTSSPKSTKPWGNEEGGPLIHWLKKVNRKRQKGLGP